MKRGLLLAFLGVLLAACSFASLDYLQDGPIPDGGSGDSISGDDGGRPQETLVPNQTTPSLLGQDDTSLYWATATGIMTAQKDGGALRQVASYTNPNSIAVDKQAGGTVLFVAFGPNVLSVQTTMEAGTPIFDADGGPTPYDVAVDTSSVFLFQYDDTQTLPGRVVRMGKDGSQVQEYKLTTEFSPSSMNIDDTTVVWSSTSDDGERYAFFSAPKTGDASAPATMFSLDSNDTTPNNSLEVALSADTIFWTDETNVYSRARMDSAVTVPIYQQPTDVSETYIQILYDGTNVYALDSVNGAVRRIAPTGGSTIVTTGMKDPAAMTIDNQYIYVAVTSEGTGGSIVRITK